MDKKVYLVQAEQDDGSISLSLQTAPQIIAREDASDYTNEALYVFDVSEVGKVKPLHIHGCWHDTKEPLYIKVVDDDDNIVFDGMGKDH